MSIRLNSTLRITDTRVKIQVFFLPYSRIKKKKKQKMITEKSMDPSVYIVVFERRRYYCTV